MTDPTAPPVEEWKPCPFCGSADMEPLIRDLARFIECQECLASAPISIWDERAQFSPPAGVVVRKVTTEGAQASGAETQSPPPPGETPRKSMPSCIRRTQESDADYTERKLAVYKQEIELLTDDVTHWKKQCKWACDNLDSAGVELTAANERAEKAESDNRGEWTQRIVAEGNANLLRTQLAAAQEAVRELCGVLGNLLQTLGTPASDIEIRNARAALAKHAP